MIRTRFFAGFCCLLFLAACGPSYEPTSVQRDLLDVAKRAERRHDYTEARREYRHLAEAGIVKAKFALATMLQDGKGGKADVQEAALWFERAAEDGDPKAMREIGRIYAEGDGVQKDVAAAGRWYAAAADTGDDAARFQLALLVLNAETGSTETAVDALETAAKNGYVPAQLELAERYETGRAVPKDPGRAVRWYTIAATALEIEASGGSLSAKSELAGLYRDGRGVPQDTRKAIQLYEELAAAGRVKSNIDLARIYERGSDTLQPDPLKAISYYEKAVAGGHAASAYDLGKKLYRGQGVPKDLSRAAYMFERAVELGDNRALIYLGDLYKSDSDLKDLSKAGLYYRRAALAGDPKAFFRLAELHDRRKLNPSDGALALALYELAAEGGYTRGNGRAEQMRKKLDSTEQGRAAELKENWRARALGQ